jgi:hypothetical protein
MEALSSSETSVLTRATRRKHPEGAILESRGSEYSLKNDIGEKAVCLQAPVKVAPTSYHFGDCKVLRQILLMVLYPLFTRTDLRAVTRQWT